MLIARTRLTNTQANNFFLTNSRGRKHEQVHALLGRDLCRGRHVRSRTQCRRHGRRGRFETRRHHRVESAAAAVRRRTSVPAGSRLRHAAHCDGGRRGGDRRPLRSLPREGVGVARRLRGSRGCTGRARRVCRAGDDDRWRGRGRCAAREPVVDDSARSARARRERGQEGCGVDPRVAPERWLRHGQPAAAGVPRFDSARRLASHGHRVRFNSRRSAASSRSDC